MIKPEVRSAVLNKTLQTVQKNKRTKEETDREIKKMRERDAELVTGIFKNLENPAVAGSTGSVTFSYLAYPGDEAVVYELWDGERYQLPRGVARHLNNNCFYREYQQLPGEFGQTGMRGAAPDGRLKTQAMQMSRKVHRFAFHSLEFMEDDTEMRPANIVEVTTTP